MDYPAQCPDSQDIGQNQDAARPQDTLNIPPACISQTTQDPIASSSVAPKPADGVSYTTAELTSLLTSLETRLSGFAEALLGVGECLDSLQTQIKELRTSRDRADGNGSESGSEAEAKEEVKNIGGGQYGNEDGRTTREGREERWQGANDGSADASEEEKRGDGETGLGNMISGFVFGGDESDNVLSKESS
ncbi:hypothetical protein CERZMDRAFT_96538 [Cercospora zeae-maydis SCOH1-5]|uniref:Uncharacterized protein n=1 Tax=Cercospora zeae-maydis SCOH1-5 TaxID=717836 RepID=A0A6A6FK89_9PEZI|nr:hypothetical protein CERZMDRAFT_96538 [Cercospora zeae-maydis SCOH1-5]